MSNLQGKTVIVTGGSRGLGRGIVEAFTEQGANVVAIARNQEHLDQLCREIDGNLDVISADVTDPVAAAKIMHQFQPDVLILNAGITPLTRPMRFQSWESFSAAWETDVKSTYLWTREALQLPMKPDSNVIIMSSGAAIDGSPLSGGYAGAKRTQWMMANYLQQESDALGLGIHFHALIPTRIIETTELGQAAASAYANHLNLPLEQFLGRFGAPLTPTMVGQGVVEMVTNTEFHENVAYKIGGEGLSAF